MLLNDLPSISQTTKINLLISINVGYNREHFSSFIPLKNSLSLIQFSLFLLSLLLIQLIKESEINQMQIHAKINEIINEYILDGFEVLPPESSEKLDSSIKTFTSYMTLM